MAFRRPFLLLSSAILIFRFIVVPCFAYKMEYEFIVLLILIFDRVSPFECLTSIHTDTHTICSAKIFSKHFCGLHYCFICIRFCFCVSVVGHKLTRINLKCALCRTRNKHHHHSFCLLLTCSLSFFFLTSPTSTTVLPIRLVYHPASACSIYLTKFIDALNEYFREKKNDCLDFYVSPTMGNMMGHRHRLHHHDHPFIHCVNARDTWFAILCVCLCCLSLVSN